MKSTPSKSSSSKSSSSARSTGSRDTAAAQARKDLQPPPTGAKGGSPAAPVMKQFQKTRAESSGRS